MIRQNSKYVEMPFEEIGRKIGTSESGARFIYNQGMEKLRTFLRDHPCYAEELFMLMRESDSAPHQLCLETPEESTPEVG